MAGDWVKLYRSLMESDIWHDEWLVKLFVWCLLKASFRDSAFKGKTIERGQFVTGRLRASEELDVSPGKWLRGIEKLVRAGCISTKSDNQFTVITVCNYESYQDGLSQGGTANGTASSTANGTANGTASSTANGTASSTRIKKIQEGEEVIKEAAAAPVQGIPTTDAEVVRQATEKVKDWPLPTGCEEKKFRPVLAHWVASAYRQHGWYDEIRWRATLAANHHYTPDQWFAALKESAVRGTKALATYTNGKSVASQGPPPRSTAKELTAP